MKIITKEYVATEGYHDLNPGVTKMTLSEVYTEGGVNVLSINNTHVPSGFNEIQLSGDKEFRLSKLGEEDSSDILFLDDVDYDKKFLRRSNICTKDIPLSQSSDFVRNWLAMAQMGSETLDVDFEYDHPLGGFWGGVDSLEVKQSLLNHISNMSNATRKGLQKIRSNPQFISDYLLWRSSLPEGTRIKYKKR